MDEFIVFFLFAAIAVIFALVVVLHRNPVVGALSLFNRQYVEAYDSLAGQLVLLVVALLFLAGLLWLRSLARPGSVERLLGTAAAEPRGLLRVGA